MGRRHPTAAALLVALVVAACGHPPPDPDDLLWRPGASLLGHLDAARVVSLPATSLPRDVATASSGPLVVEYAADDWTRGRPVPPDAKLRSLPGLTELDAGARRFHLPDAVRLDLPRGTLTLAVDGRPLVPFREGLGVGLEAQKVFVDDEGPTVVWFAPTTGRLSMIAGRAPESFVVAYAGADGDGVRAWEWAEVPPPDDAPFPTVVTDPALLPDAARLARRVTLAGATRDALVVPAPGAVGFDVDLREVDSVSLSVGLVDHAFEALGDSALRASGLSDGARASLVLERANERTELWAGDVAPGAAWVEVDVPLGGALDDPRCTLWLVSDAGGDAAFDYVAWADLRARGRARPPAPDRPNIVLVVLDTLRDDTVGQRRPPTTPRLDAWAARHDATRYVDTRAPAPWTLPSTVSMLTGLDPLQHGVDQGTERMGSGLPHVAEALAGAGYETRARTGGGYLSPAFGLDRGFATFVERSDDVEVPDWSDVHDWLAARRSEQPFFLLLHTYHVHASYPHDARFEDADDPYAGPLAGRDVDYDGVIVPYIDGSLSLDASDRAYVRRMYDAGAARTDEVLTETLELLVDLGLLDDTVVLVTSDHGEELFEHGAIGHGHSLHHELVAVPLVVRWPSRDGLPPRARASRRRTSLVDVAPTLLDLAGLEPSPQVVGRSLLDDVPPTRALISSLPDQRRYGDGDFALLLGPDGRVALYDTDDDPLGERNLASRQPERVARMRRVLADLEAALPPVEAGADSATLDPEAVEALRAMGYLEDS